MFDALFPGSFLVLLDEIVLVRFPTLGVCVEYARVAN